MPGCSKSKVTICIPTYEQPEKFQVLIDSILMQSYKNYEIVVSDDSRSQDIKKIVGAIQTECSLRYYKNKVPLGSPQNWNNAINYAKGDYIKLMHHDDSFAHAQALARFVEVLDHHPACSFVFSSSFHCDEAGRVYASHVPNQRQLTALSLNPESLFVGNTIGAPSAILFRRVHSMDFDKHMKWLVDIDFYIRMIKKYGTPIYTQSGLVKITVGTQQQITSQCHYNRELDLREHMLLFGKIAVNNNDMGVCKVKWLKLFERYWIRELADIMKTDFFDEKMMVYFSDLLRKNKYRFIYRWPFYLYHFLKRNRYERVNNHEQAQQL